MSKLNNMTTNELKKLMAVEEEHAYKILNRIDILEEELFGLREKERESNTAMGHIEGALEGKDGYVYENRELAPVFNISTGELE